MSLWAPEQGSFLAADGWPCTCPRGNANKEFPHTRARDITRELGFRTQQWGSAKRNEHHVCLSGYPSLTQTPILFTSTVLYPPPRLSLCLSLSIPQHEVEDDVRGRIWCLMRSYVCLCEMGNSHAFLRFIFGPLYTEMSEKS